MYKTIYVPVDNSEHSNAAIEVAVALGRAFGANLVGSHVYGARMHDYRFRQMEYTLPPEYQGEEEMEKQRRIHDSLITMGLQLISDSYLEVMAQKAAAAGLTCRKVMIDGKNYAELVRDIRGSNYDLVVIGALGMGAAKPSSLGSVCERVVRRIETDTLVVKSVIPPHALPEAPIVVGIDGSLQSYAGLQAGIARGKAFDRILRYVRQTEAWMLVLGRIGVHSDDGLDIGSNTENLLRLAPCHVLITSRKFYPPMDVKAEASIAWTPEAEARMERVPGFVKAMARTAVLRFALERGHSVITKSVIEQVMDIFMPRRTAEKTQDLALELAVDAIRSGRGPGYICRGCGH